MQKPRLTKRVVDALFEASIHLQQEVENDELRRQSKDFCDLHEKVVIAIKYIHRLYHWYNYKQEKNNDKIATD
jgi:hypothetical protein